MSWGHEKDRIYLVAPASVIKGFGGACLGEVKGCHPLKLGEWADSMTPVTPSTNSTEINEF